MGKLSKLGSGLLLAMMLAFGSQQKAEAQENYIGLTPYTSISGGVRFGNSTIFGEAGVNGSIILDEHTNNSIGMFGTVGYRHDPLNWLGLRASIGGSGPINNDERVSSFNANIGANPYLRVGNSSVLFSNLGAYGVLTTDERLNTIGVYGNAGLRTDFNRFSVSGFVGGEVPFRDGHHPKLIAGVNVGVRLGRFTGINAGTSLSASKYIQLQN